MCRSIKILNQPGQHATDQETHDAALQYVRKISGFRKPSRANEAAFQLAVAEIAAASKRLLQAVPRRQPAPVSDAEVSSSPSMEC